MPITVADFSDFPAGQRGVIADGSPCSFITRTVVGGISFGAAAFDVSTRPSSCASLPTNGAFLGIVSADVGEVPVPFSFGGAGLGADGFDNGASVSVLRRGSVWVLVASNVSASAPAYHTAAGALTSVGSGNTAIRGSFTTSASAGSLAILRLAL